MADARRLAWPARPRLLLYLRLLALLTLLFALVYGGCNWLAQWRGSSVGLYADWELALPFVPAMIYVYLSIGGLFLLPLFCLDGDEMRALAKAFAVATLAAGAVFLLLPAHLGHPRPPTVPGHDAFYALVYRLDLVHNTVPSLHITYSTLIVRIVGGVLPGRGSAVLHAWLALMAVAVVLVRQHHLLDVAAGLALGWACHRYYLRALRRRAAQSR
jgi:membrane-associated phospholipid phosphatase